MPQADAFNNTMPPEHPQDIIDELQAGIGVLLHLGASSNPNLIEPEEISFLASALHAALSRLQSAVQAREWDRTLPEVLAGRFPNTRNTD